MTRGLRAPGARTTRAGSEQTNSVRGAETSLYGIDCDAVYFEGYVLQGIVHILRSSSASLGQRNVLEEGVAFSLAWNHRPC